MNKITRLIAVLTLVAIPALAADTGIVGKNGETLPVQDLPGQLAGGGTRADVEYNTGGTVDMPATTGGSVSGWGSYFIGSWQNTTGQDVSLVEVGWPCGGPGPVELVVWITDDMPGAPYTATFADLFTPADGDPAELPPDTYTYIDISAWSIVIPAGTSFFFGYENPGIGGQIDTNGVDTWAWYNGAWDSDSAWGRTALLQFKGNFIGVATEQLTFSQVKTLFN